MMPYDIIAFIPLKTEMDDKKFVRQIRNQFENSPVKIKAGKGIIELLWPGFTFLIGYGEQLITKREISRIVNNYAKKHPNKKEILSSKKQITFQSTNDPIMEHFNDYVLLIEIIEKYPGVIIFEQEREEFLDPEGGYINYS